MSGKGEPDFIYEGSIQKAIASDREQAARAQANLFEKAVPFAAEKIKGDGFEKAQRTGFSAVRAIRECRYNEALGKFVDANSELRLLKEGYEHLGIKDNIATVDDLINRLRADFVEAMMLSCSCK